MRHPNPVTTLSSHSLSPVTVLGAGAWGTALAIRLAYLSPVRLWGRDKSLKKMQKERCNVRYLPEISLPDTVYCTPNLEEAIQETHDILIAVPSHALPSLFQKLNPFLTENTRLLIATKGLYPDTSELLSSWLNTFNSPYALLSGPSFAKEVAQGLPAALVIASQHADCVDHWKERLHQPNLQIYPSNDVAGVALCGAMKNVVAIAVGMASGLNLGENMNAFLMTQGLFEMQQLGQLFGAHPKTFLSPAGVGDLSLTCMNDTSRNRRFGVLVGQGLSSDEAQQQLGLLSEGILNARAIYQLCEDNTITLPLCQMVYTVLSNKLSSKEAMCHFMNNIISHVTKY